METRAESLGRRLKARVDSSAGPSACWPWTGATNNTGYGVLGVGRNKLVLAHRATYELHIRALRPREVVMHSCDNRRCCNPAHLSAVSQQENLVDMARKGRSTSPLTEAQARAILHDSRPYRVVAADYGVSHNTVGRIKRKQDWAWL